MKPVSDAAWSVKYYTTQNGDSPIAEFLDELPGNERAKADKHIDLLRKVGTKIGMPHARPLKGHKPLWELRPMPNRFIYVTLSGKQFVILHAFTKKQDKTPDKEIKIAENRLAELRERMAEEKENG